MKNTVKKVAKNYKCCRVLYLAAAVEIGGRFFHRFFRGVLDKIRQKMRPPITKAGALSISGRNLHHLFHPFLYESQHYFQITHRKFAVEQHFLLNFTIFSFYANKHQVDSFENIQFNYFNTILSLLHVWLLIHFSSY